MAEDYAGKKPEKRSSGKRLSRLVAQSYMDLHQRAAEGYFVIWVAINVPVELFAGFERVVYGVPESHAATSAAKGVGSLQCEKAEKIGYSMDLCSYARIDLGTVIDGGNDSPTWGLPKPHLLVSDNNNCSLLVKWFDVHHRTMGIPHFVIDVPFCYEQQQEKDLQYIIRQFEDLIELIEKMSGQRFNPDRAQEAVRNTNEANRHWKRFLDCAKHHPSGITAFDSFVQMAPFLTLRGTPELVEHYRLLADETEENVGRELFPVPNEKYRLFWDNIAPWHQLRSMSARLRDLDANIVAASYTSCIGTIEGSFDLFEYDGGDPLRYLARTQNSYMCPHGMRLRLQSMTGLIEKLGIDGVIFASNRSCKPYSVTQIDQQRFVAGQLPAVMIEVDHADVRKYSEESAFLRIEALIERIASKKSAALS
jgi:benzoyl-CoA reductase/2-hydroxyglutaryl-CoA dehydratase subunit BcrC/BadD/HgdB